VQPTVLLNPDLKSKVYTDEIFGPVISVRTFKTEEEAIQLANDTQYGLGSTVYTSDIGRALRIASQIEAGTVGINSAFNVSRTVFLFLFPLVHCFRRKLTNICVLQTSPQTPFGGFKQSGYGRESGVEGIKNYLQPKTIHVNMNLPAGKKMPGTT